MKSSMQSITRRLVVGLCCGCVLVATGLGTVRGQDGPRTELSGLLSEARQLEQQVARVEGRGDRLQRQVTRLLDRANELVEAGASMDRNKLERLLDSTAVVQSDLFDVAPRVHPERLVEVERSLALVERIRRQACALRYPPEQSAEATALEVAKNADATAEALVEVLNDLRTANGGGAASRADSGIDRLKSIRTTLTRASESRVGILPADVVRAANQASVLRSELLIWMVADPTISPETIQSARRAALHLENELRDLASFLAREQKGSSPGRLLQLVAATGEAISDSRALEQAAVGPQRIPLQTITSSLERVQLDIENLARDPRYAPRARLDDIFGRINRVLRETDAYRTQASERTIAPLGVVQADLASLREQVLMAAADYVGSAESEVVNLPRQAAKPAPSAEARLGVKWNAQNGRLTIAGVQRPSLADAVGLRQGDQIVQVNEQRVGTDAAVARALEASLGNNRSARIVALRDGRQVTAQIRPVEALRHANRLGRDTGNR